MDYEDKVETVFHEPDFDTNTQTVTLKVPDYVDPEAAKKMFLNALWGVVDREA
ncbi:hypothetical protein [Siphovirus Jomon_CT89]|nr:hypothetical protein [Siphovirus Jomon_CT89]